MSTIPAPNAVTKQYDFCKTSHDGEMLFSVRAGIPLSRAFDQLSIFISSTQSIIESVAECDDGVGANWAASQMLDVAFALTQAMHNGLIDHEKAQPRP